MADHSGPHKPRIAPLLPPDWDAAAQDAVSVFPAGRDFIISGFKSGAKAVQGMNLMGTQLHHPTLTKAVLPLNAHVAKGNTLSTRVRELLILRIAWLQRSEYEYVQHIRQGKLAGLSEAEIERVQHGPDAPGWDPLDADLLRAVDELHAVARIQDATWQRLSAHFDTRQLMDIIFVTGCYGVMSMFCNTWGVQLEDPATALDPATRARLLRR
jgi:4-carboxymuconolactone decarboxylase